MVADETTLLETVHVSEARHLARIFDQAVQHEHPVRIARNKREQGILLSTAQLGRTLEHLYLTVDVIPEESEGFTLWVRELNMGSHAGTLLEARAQLLHDVRSYVRHCFAHWDMYRHMVDTQAQLPFALRLSLAQDDKELARTLRLGMPAPREQRPQPHHDR